MVGDDREVADAVASSPVTQEVVSALLEGASRLEVWVGGVATHVFVTRRFPGAWPPVLEHCGG